MNTTTKQLGAALAYLAAKSLGNVDAMISASMVLHGFDAQRFAPAQAPRSKSLMWILDGGGR